MNWNPDTEPLKRYNFNVQILNEENKSLIESFQIQKFEKQAWETFIVTFVPIHKDVDILSTLHKNIGKIFNIIYSLYNRDTDLSLPISQRQFKVCLVDYEICSEYSSDLALEIKLHFDGGEGLIK